MIEATERVSFRCAHCGGAFTPPSGASRASQAKLADEESVRCRRLVEIQQQRQALRMRLQSGIAGLIGGDVMDSNDFIQQRRVLAQLEVTLQTEAEQTVRQMVHVPAR